MCEVVRQGSLLVLACMRMEVCERLSWKLSSHSTLYGSSGLTDSMLTLHCFFLMQEFCSL